MVKVFLYSGLAGLWPKWTLAVYAVSQADADQRVRNHWGGGRRVGEIRLGKVHADCGTITDAAQREISEDHRRWLDGEALIDKIEGRGDG